MSWQKVTRTIFILALVALVIIQFIRPDKNAEGYESVTLFETETRTSSKVSVILKENCYDCHSAQTQYPWYAEIAPLSLWLSDHIKEGKKHFNVSAWQQYSIKKKDHKLEEVLEMIEDDKMPLWSYSLLHGALSEDEKTLLLQWAGVARLQYRHQLEVSVK
ncbi:heme-binding domain-containing protein [Aequorivita capsosiphonis]|uniref:heme-binding domain-containing protein n=1 Tax=Aequorivita capsosiphonis TaxID=487317 RepID=UPI00041ABA13|nr:heme-binding domain-containing protein [Aequorivita capsosiphonis]